MDRTQPSRPSETGALSERSVRFLARLLEETTGTLDLDELLRRVSGTLREALGHDSLALLLLDDLGQQLTIRHAEGLPEAVVERWRFGMGQGLVGHAAEARELVVVNDVRADPRYIAAVPDTRSEAALPLVVASRLVGVLAVSSHEADHFDAERLRFLCTLAGPLGNAIENARLYANLREHARSMSLLHEVSRELAAILDRERLLTKVAELVRRLIDYQLFTLMLWNEETQRLEHAFSVRYDERFREKGAFPLGYGLCGTAAALRQSIRVPNVHLDARYVSRDHGVPVNSELVVPLMLEDRLLGVLDLEATEYNAFSEQHERLLATLSSSIVIALENARLYETVAAQERLVQDDLHTAREIQRRLLPEEAPSAPGLEIAFRSIPARQIGGDFYDVLPYPDGRLLLAVGDAAGKGISGALYGALSVGMLRNLVVQSRGEPDALLAQLNDQLDATQLDNRFLALAAALYCPDEGSLVIGCAGFPRPWLLRGGRARQVPIEGLALGVLPGVPYGQQRLCLQLNDVVVVASDGVDDMTDAWGEPFGRERLQALLEEHSGRTAEEIAAAILEAGDRHAGRGHDVDDDRTVLALRAVPR